MDCGHLMPNHCINLTPDGEYLPCLLPEGHKEEHLVRLVCGKFICWEIIFLCECAEESCGCFQFWKAPEERVMKFLETQKTAPS